MIITPPREMYCSLESNEIEYLNSMTLIKCCILLITIATEILLTV